MNLDSLSFHLHALGLHYMPVYVMMGIHALGLRYMPVYVMMGLQDVLGKHSTFSALISLLIELTVSEQGLEGCISG